MNRGFVTFFTTKFLKVDSLQFNSKNTRVIVLLIHHHITPCVNYYGRQCFSPFRPPKANLSIHFCICSCSPPHFGSMVFINSIWFIVQIILNINIFFIWQSNRARIHRLHSDKKRRSDKFIEQKTKIENMRLGNAPPQQQQFHSIFLIFDNFIPKFP